MDDNRISHQPEWDALHAFDAANNVEPARTIAERIAKRFYVGAPSPLVDAIAHAIEDAHDLGVRRGPLIPPRSGDPGQ